MPESFIQLPPQSTGLKAHTWQRTIGANAVEDEVVVIGEPYLASYVAVWDGAAVTISGTHSLQIMAGASLKVRIRRISISQDNFATATGQLKLRVVRLTTAGTGGTVITPIPLDSTSPVAGATAMRVPTVNGAEGVSLHTFPMQMLTGNPIPTPTYEWEWSPARGVGGIVIPAGTANGICLKVVAGIAGATSVHIVVEFDEANF